MEAANSNIHLHLTAGDAGKHPEVLSLQSETTFHKDHVEKIRQQLNERGIPRDLLDEKQHLFVVELGCNPGCEKELAQELLKVIGSETSEEEVTVFQKVVEVFDESDMECKVFESQNKVYLVAHEKQPRVLSEECKVKAFYDNFRPTSNINLSITAEGFKVTRKPEEGEQAEQAKEGKEERLDLSLSYFDFLLDSPNIRDLGTRLHKYLNAIKEDFPLIAVLPQIKRVNIRSKMSSLEEIAKSMNFTLSYEEVVDLFEQGKTLVHNEFRVYYLNLAGFLVDTTVKIDDLRFMLSKYLFRVLDYVSKMVL